MPARTDNNQIIAKDNSKQPQYFHNVKVGLLGAFDVKKKTFDQWRMKSKDKILWKEINGTVEINDSFTNTFYEYDTVENFFLDKQLLIGKHGSTNPSKPIRGLLREIFRVSIRLSKRTIKLNFNVSLAYFEKQEVLQLLLYDTIPHIDIDSLIFVKQCKWYTSTKVGWKIETDYSDSSSVTSINKLCRSLLSITGLDAKNINKGWPFFDFIELDNVSPKSNFAGDIKLSISEYFALVTGDEGYRLVDPKADYVTNVINNNMMKFVGRKYFQYHFSLTSCVAFFSKDRHEIRKAWSNYYKDNVGYIPLLYEYTHFTNSLPCISDGILLLIERCLLRYAELDRVYVELTNPNLAKRILEKTIGKDFVQSILFRLDDLDIIVDNALWIIAYGYEDILFGYNKLKSGVESAIERRSRSIYERITLIVALFVVFLTITSLFHKSADEKEIKDIQTSPSSSKIITNHKMIKIPLSVENKADGQIANQQPILIPVETESTDTTNLLLEEKTLKP